MSGIKDSDRIEALRKRLYDRGGTETEIIKHELTDTPVDVPRVWQRTGETAVSKPSTPPTGLPADTVSVPPPVRPVANSLQQPPQPPPNEPTLATMAPRPRRKSYRLKLLAAGAIFFVLAIMVSSIILMFGNNGISGENITISVTGPFTIGGGEVIPLQVGVTNGNTVAIESATLIVEYPRGTLGANEERKELFSERLSLNTVAAGETVNVPLRAVVFGEENQEQQIEVSIEYRVQGSNALFFKEAEPLRFKISSSPLVLTVDALKRISSGQSTDVTMNIRSNSPSTLRDVMVIAEYPVGFTYTEAKPAPSAGQNMWIIPTLEPEQTVSIVVNGVVVGNETDEFAMNFSVGVPNERDSRTLASVFATAQTEFEIEQPFLGITINVGGIRDGIAVVKPIERTTVSVDVQNTLSDALYDIVAEVQLSGNAISDLEVGPPNGFYDSAAKTITWDISSTPELEELQPGQRTRLTFAIAPSGDVHETPEINITVNIRGRRVSESQVPETLSGTANATLKVASAPTLRADVTHGSGVFPDSGPVPPRAEQKTSYTISFMAENGTNNLSGAVVTATLPTYVTWESQTAGAGVFTYDQVKRLVTWNVGSVSAQSSAIGSFQVSLVPSRSQLGIAPTLVGEQVLRADDLFTGTAVTDTNAAITTEMSTETGYPRGNGRVVE